MMKTVILVNVHKFVFRFVTEIGSLVKIYSSLVMEY